MSGWKLEWWAGGAHEPFMKAFLDPTSAKIMGRCLAAIMISWD
jgi:hypothetical protein